MKLFLSHSSRDKSLVREVASLLPSFITVWLDERDLTIGAELEQSLREAIQKEVDYILVFLGRDSVKSQWVKKELNWAHRKELRGRCVLSVIEKHSYDCRCGNVREGQPGHNVPKASPVIAAKFPFGSDYVSDFAFLTVNSMECQFTFVEIEAPTKAIFNKDFSFTGEFHKALQQVRDWQTWAAKNTDALVNMYADLLNGYDVTRDLKTAKSYLVYGRRVQVETPILAKERWVGLGQSLGSGIEVMTYDRLTANIALQRHSSVPNTYAICSYKQRGFYWKSSVVEELA